jgi:hypothetical protein
MALEKTERNGIVFIDRAKNQDYKFFSASAGEDCGDQLFTQGGGLDLPVLQSYKFNASQGLQLTAQINIQQPLLNQLFGIDLDENPPIRITTWNLKPRGSAAIDVFPHKKSPAVLADTIRAKITSANFAQGWPDIVAAAIIEEVESLKSQGGRGGETRFTDAVNSALYENQSPQQSLNSIMKLETFCVQAGRAMLGLGTNDLPSTFKYNFGASLLFNPDLYITEKGIATVSMYAKGPYSPDRELICGKAIVIYNSSRDRASESLSGSNLSFSFRPDDTFSDAEAVANHPVNGIMAAARNFSDANFTEGQLAQLKMTDSNWRAGNGWTSDVIQIEGGLKVRTGLNPPGSRGAGVFNISFAFNFGTENGSLTLSNLILAFTFDIAAYAAAVSAVQQMKARVREAFNNYKSLLASRALAHANANKTEGGAPAPTTNVDLNSNANTTTNYTTRDQNAADALKNGSNITEGPGSVTTITAPVNVIQNVNGNNDGRITTFSDPLMF